MTVEERSKPPLELQVLDIAERSRTAFLNGWAPTWTGAFRERLTAAGLVIVPREPTEAMLRDLADRLRAINYGHNHDLPFGVEARRLWPAMLTACQENADAG